MRRRVRSAYQGDAEAIARVHSETWRVTYAGLLAPSYLAALDVEALEPRWRGRLGRPDRTGVLVAEEAGRVVGFATFAGTTGDADLAGFAGEIEMLYVHPAAQRRGHGRALFDGAVGSMTDHPYYWLVVWVVEANHAARAFYRHVGLRVDGARRTERMPGKAVHTVRYAGPLNPVVIPAAPASTSAPGR